MPDRIVAAGARDLALLDRADPPDDIAKYKGRYLAGWDKIRERRWRRMTEMGIAHTPLTTVERGLGPPYAFPEVLTKVGPNEVNLPVESALRPVNTEYIKMVTSIVFARPQRSPSTPKNSPPQAQPMRNRLVT